MRACRLWVKSKCRLSCMGFHGPESFWSAGDLEVNPFWVSILFPKLRWFWNCADRGTILHLLHKSQSGFVKVIIIRRVF